MPNFSELYTYVFSFYGFIIVVNTIILIFAGKIVDFLDTSDLEKRNLTENSKNMIIKKTKFLRLLVVSIFIIYFITFAISASFLNQLISCLFIFLVIYLTTAWIERRILLFYGEDVEISGEKYVKRGYKTNMFTLILRVISILVTIFSIFKIFNIDSIFEGGGIIAGILAFIGFTASVWAPDLVAGINILHNDEIEVGNVIRIKNKGILAWVKNISLSEVKLIDLVYYHPIIMRPSKFRELYFENLSHGVTGKKSQIPYIIDIKVGYEYNLEDVKKLCFEAFDNMIESVTMKDVERGYFPETIVKDVQIGEFLDDAILYKFTYYLTSPFYIIKAERLLNSFLQESQNKYKISFSTPSIIDLKSKNGGSNL
ncbi:hypothetical protein CSA08_02105 [Candidatus Gracilibacteria bacterium]|nr:MAG: hypothetical protein CSA08_02105 [Candidatus Gracilibacteria bacterium]